MCLSSSNDVMCESTVVDLVYHVRVKNLNRALLSLSSNITYRQGCISCGILVSGIGAHGVSSEHMENMEMFSCSPT